MGKLLLSRKSRTILLESKSINRHHDLHDFLIHHPTFKDSDWEQAPQSVRIIEGYFPTLVNELISTCAREWKYTGSIQGVKVNDDGSLCGLCGYPRCKTLFPISNIFNKKVLYIGSECVKDFGFDGKEEVMLISAQQDTLIAYKALIDMRPRVFKEFVLIKNCYADIKEFLIPNPLYGRCKELAEAIRNAAKDFLHEGKRVVSLTKIDSLIAEYDAVKRDIDGYISINQNNWLAPKTADINNISSKNRSKAVEILRKESLIGKATIHLFSSLDFLNMHIRNKIIDAIASHGFSVSDAVETSIGTGFMINKTPDLPLFLWYAHFAQQFNYVLLSNSPIMIRRIEIVLECCRIISEFGNFLIASRNYFSRLNISLLDYSEDANEFHFRYDGAIYHASLSLITQNFLMKHIFIKEESPEKLMSTLLSSQKHADYEDYLDYLENNKRAGFGFIRL